MKCKLCDSNMRLEAHFSFKCTVCEHIFVNYTENGLEYHKSSYRKNNHGTRGDNEISDGGLFTDNFHSYRKPIVNKRIEFLSEYISKSNSVLDIGAGGGTFAGALKNHIKEVYVQEISDLCINNLNRMGFTIFQGDFSSINYNGSTFDLVTCFHVLEHIEDLNKFYDTLKLISAKYVAVEVPIDRPLIEHQDKWDGHYHYFSRTSLVNYFSRDFDIKYLGDGVQNPCLLIILEKK